MEIIFLHPLIHHLTDTRRCRTSVIPAALLLSISLALQAQSDPGPRPGAPAAGSAVSGLTPAELSFFQTGLTRFQETEDVPTNGLGPRFNATSCASCHAFPTVGGSSPASNPQISFANGHNTLPPFISPTGPVRAARFINKPDGTPDGGVHSLFTIMGHTGTPSSCQLQQEDFSNAANISLRIPTPLFGLGLIEAISDAALEANLAANSAQKAQLRISGTFNRNANDGTITRFGWKAQNKSLHIFSGEAYNVEMGITNLLFPNERDDTPGCSPSVASMIASISPPPAMASLTMSPPLPPSFAFLLHPLPRRSLSPPRAVNFSSPPSAVPPAIHPLCRPVSVHSVPHSAIRSFIPTPISPFTTWAPL